MALVSQTYTGQFLTAAELTPLGQRRTAIVHAVTVEAVGQGPDAKQAIVLELTSPAGRAWPKRAVLNKTNSTTLAATYGDDTDAWIGKPVDVWAENVMFRGAMVPGLKLAPAHNRPAGNGGAAPVKAAPGIAMPHSPTLNQQIDPLLDDEIPF